MKVLDLYSGIGGFSLGLDAVGMETVAFCEILPECQEILRSHWPNVPIFDDVRTLTAADIPPVDVICGGFPCQDISTAGRQRGLAGVRSGLWAEYARLIGEIRPKYVIVENVTALLTGGEGRWFGQVLGDLASVGYDAEWHCIPAAYFGAPHHRDRVWILAYPNTPRCEVVAPVIKYPLLPPKGSRDWEVYAPRLFAVYGRVFSSGNGSLLRINDGPSRGLDRVRIIGGTVFIPIVEAIGRAIIAEEERHARAAETV